MANVARQSGFVTEARQATRELWLALQKLEAMQREWNALDYSNTLTEAAFGGENAPVTAQNVSDVIFTTTNAIRAVLDAGNGTNLARLL